MTVESRTDGQAAPDSTDGNGEAVVTVEDLDRSFGDLEVLSGVSFAVPPGSVTCLVGSNGSGKTTLLRLVAGLLAPDAGTVRVRASGERPVGYLPQRPDFRHQFTVAETLAFYGDLLPTDVDVDATLERVGLTPVRDRRVGALSGGMIRLLGIGQSTLGDPRLLVLDEPSSGLDPTVTRHVRDVIESLGGAGRSVLLATHDLGTVERVADQVLVLHEGNIAARGSPAALTEATDTEALAEAVPALIEDAGPVSVSAGRQGGDGA